MYDSVREHHIRLAQPILPPAGELIGRQYKLALCKAAWGVDPDTNELNLESKPVPFCLRGDPGTGTNELVFQVVRELRVCGEPLPLYVLHGNDGVTPEDLSLLLVPDQ